MQVCPKPRRCASAWPSWRVSRAWLLGDPIVHVVGGLAVAFAGGVLVDQRGAHAGLAHPDHQLAGAGAGRGGQHVAGAVEVVEVEAVRHAGLVSAVSCLAARGKLPVRSSAPLSPVRTSDPSPSLTCSVRCSSSVARAIAGRVTTRRPAADLGGPKTSSRGSTSGSSGLASPESSAGSSRLPGRTRGAPGGP